MRSAFIACATVASALAMLLVSAIVIAIADLYVTGHGGQSLGREWIEVNDNIISLSRADVIVLTAAFIGAIGGFLGAKAGMRD